MRILLVNPSIAKEEVYSKYSVGAPSLPPLGLCYLAAVLLRRGHEVIILDCAAEQIPISQLKRKVHEFLPDLVGITSTTVSYAAAKRALNTIKETNREIITVLGGAHISALPSATMEECKYIDVGVVGEGEFTLAEIVERLVNKDSLTDVAGALVRHDGRIIGNKPRKPVSNLDKIPFPARHLLKDLRLYSHTPFRGGKFMTTMITSRGCPFSCAYCDQSVFGRSWRSHSPGYIVEEMLLLKKNYNIDFVSFEDDNFLLSNARAMDICDRMTQASLDISWSCLGRANEVDGELLPLMKRAGCKNIYIGIESGSPRILKLINKKMSIEETRKGISLIKDFGIKVTGSFIFGLPTETKKDIQRTIDLALSLPLDGITFFTFTPFPNTPLRELAFQHGKVSPEWEHYSGHPSALPFLPNGISKEYLLGVQTKAYRQFLLRPGYILRHLGTFWNRRAVGNGIRFIKALLPG